MRQIYQLLFRMGAGMWSGITRLQQKVGKKGSARSACLHSPGSGWSMCQPDPPKLTVLSAAVGKMYVRFAATLQDVESFDASMFRCVPFPFLLILSSQISQSPCFGHECEWFTVFASFRTKCTTVIILWQAYPVASHLHPFHTQPGPHRGVNIGPASSRVA